MPLKKEKHRETPMLSFFKIKGKNRQAQAGYFCLIAASMMVLISLSDPV